MTMRRSFTGNLLTEKQQVWIERQTAPCGKFVALEHLDWLSAHKRMENDVNRMTVLKRDYAEILGHIPEYALALAVVWFIEKSNSKWWPDSVDTIKSKAEEFMVPQCELFSDTNASILAKEHLGEHIARSWFNRTVIHERTLYGSSSYNLGWIKNHYLSVLCDFIDDVAVVGEFNEKTERTEENAVLPTPDTTQEHST